MDMQVATDVGKLDQARQVIFLRQRDFSAILAQLWRYIGQSKLAVDICFICPGDRLITIEQPIFVELPAALISNPAKRNIVGLGAGEIEERRPICLLYTSDAADE